MGRDPHSRFLHEDEYSTKNPSPILKGRGNATGAASGRASRFKALDAMIQRRLLNKKEAAEESRRNGRGAAMSMSQQAQRSAASPQKKGVLIKSGSGMTQEEMERMIRGGK